MSTDTVYNGGFTETLVKKTFFNHVFSTTEEGKAEIFNILQYAGIALVPVVILNKLVQRFIPDADPDKSSLEISFEVVLQLAVLFIGIILIHRVVTFVPTWSGYKYEQIALTSTVLTFLIIVLSIQTKLGIKVSILAERISDLWNGTDSRQRDEDGEGKNVRVKHPVSKMITGGHTSSQADFIDNPKMQNDLFPPAPTATTKGSAQKQQQTYFEPAPANSIIGSSFGSLF